MVMGNGFKRMVADKEENKKLTQRERFIICGAIVPLVILLSIIGYCASGILKKDKKGNIGIEPIH